MHEYIHKYFALNKKVVLPGMGSFMAEMQNAKLDFINKTLQAPLHIIRYDQNNSADEKFYNFLSKETGLNETEAANNFNHFTNELKEQLEVNHVLELKGIGTLTKNASGYSFDANNTIQDFFPEIAAERVIR